MKTITKEAKTESIAEITDFVDGELLARDCPIRQLTQIRVAIDELVSNVVHYAYPSGTGLITVGFSFEEDTRTAVLTFEDDGIPYDPLKTAEPDISLPAEKRRIGGLGIFIVRRTMDDVSYVREDGRNILTIRKKI